MAFEMSLPHAPRIRVVAPDGGETHAEDEAQWALYYSVQRALQEVGAVGVTAHDSCSALAM
jgi:hypothetical protein